VTLHQVSRRRKRLSWISAFLVAGVVAGVGCSSGEAPSAQDCVTSGDARVCVSDAVLTGAGLQGGSRVQWLIDYAPDRGEHGQSGGEVVADASGKVSSPVEFPSTGVGTNTIEVMARTKDGVPLTGNIVVVVSGSA
jgi:hypothetical protein